MMVKRADIAAAARRRIGTPFVHQGRLDGIGLDCAGVVIRVAQELGLSDFDTRDYPAQPNPVAMRAALLAHLEVVRFAEIDVGDVLWFKVELDPQHLALLVSREPLMMVHAFSKPGVMKVIEAHVDAFWRSRIAGCFRYRGVG